MVVSMSTDNYIEFLLDRQFLDLELGLRAEERELLEVIAAFAYNGMPLCVRGVMELAVLASPATLHRRLNTLLTAGLIKHVHEGGDMRTKFVMPTLKALEYFERAATAMQKASAR